MLILTALSRWIFVFTWPLAISICWRIIFICMLSEGLQWRCVVSLMNRKIDRDRRNQMQILWWVLVISAINIDVIIYIYPYSFPSTRGGCKRKPSKPEHLANEDIVTGGWAFPKPGDIINFHFKVVTSQYLEICCLQTLWLTSLIQSRYPLSYLFWTFQFLFQTQF